MTLADIAWVCPASLGFIAGLCAGTAWGYLAGVQSRAVLVEPHRPLGGGGSTTVN